MKTCKDCKIDKPFSNFFKNKKMTDGRLHSCKDCCRNAKRKYVDLNRELVAKRLKDWKLKNKDKVDSYMKEYRLTNKDDIKKVSDLWKKNNRERYLTTKNAASAQRRASKKCAFVKWANKKKIKALYKEAQALTILTGVQHHVDHILPLTSDLICGLHCEDNLRVIPFYLNLSKGNKLIEDIV